MKSAHVRIGVRDGRCVGIEDVPSGLACNCVCAGCLRPLIARKGSIRAHHFAHRPGTDCETAGETTLHRAAKQLLAEKRRLWLPEFKGSTARWLTKSMSRTPMWAPFQDWVNGTIYDAYLAVADTVNVESTFGEMRPDVVVVMDDGRELLVEIRVTHAVDQEKRRRIRSTGRACVEIDLSSVPRDVTLHDLASRVIGGGEDAAPRRWISCPKGDKVDARRHLTMKKNFVRAVQSAHSRRDVGGFDEAVVRGCPIIHYKERHQAHIDDCIACSRHVAYFDGSIGDSLHAAGAGRRFPPRTIYCDHPRRPIVKIRGSDTATVIMADP